MKNVFNNKKLTTSQLNKLFTVFDDIDEEDEDDGENTNVQHVPNIRNLEVDIEREDDVNQFTLGSLFGQGGSSVSRRSRRSKSVDDFISEKSRSGE